MKKVCVNRLKADVDKLQQFVSSMDHQEETLEQLFQCLLKLFENEVAHGNPSSVQKTNSNDMLGQVNARNGLLMNSQQSSGGSIFNSNKHNISGLDSAVGGMSFGRATEDGHQVRPFNAMTNNLMGQKNGVLLNMSRQYKSDRNVFGKPSNSGVGGSSRKIIPTPLQEELESEVVHMGELLRDSTDKKELKARMTQDPLKINIKQKSSPRFNQSPMSNSNGRIENQNQNLDAFQPQSRTHRCSQDSSLIRIEDSNNEQNFQNQNPSKSNQRNALSARFQQQNVNNAQPVANQTENNENHLQETPYLNNERSCKKAEGSRHTQNQNSQQQLQSQLTYGLPSYSPLKGPVFPNNVLQESYESVNTSKLLANLSNVQQSQSMLRASRQGQVGGASRSFKEVIKVFVQMMVEDIWTYYEGFSWQKKVLLQSGEKKKRHHMQKQQQPTPPVKKNLPGTPQQSTTKTKKHESLQPRHSPKSINQQTKLSLDINQDSIEISKEKGDDKWQGLKTQSSRECPHESKVEAINGKKIVRPSITGHISKTEMSDDDTFKSCQEGLISSSPSYPPSHDSDSPTKIQNETQPQGKQTNKVEKNRYVEGLFSLDMSQKSSIISDYKMDFIDPSKISTNNRLTDIRSKRGQMVAYNGQPNNQATSRLTEGQRVQHGHVNRSARYMMDNSITYEQQQRMMIGTQEINNNNMIFEQPVDYLASKQQQQNLNMGTLQDWPVAQSQARELGFVLSGDELQHGVKLNKSEENLITNQKLHPQGAIGKNHNHVTNTQQSTKRGPYCEIGQGKQQLQQQLLEEQQHQQNQQNLTRQTEAMSLVKREANLRASRDAPSAMEREMLMQNLRQEMKLSMTTNSLVSPADLELNSEIEEYDMNQQANLILTQTVDPNQIKLSLDQQQTSQEIAAAKIQPQDQMMNMISSKDNGVQNNSNEMIIPSEITRRMLQNVVAIEKDLKLYPSVSNQIGIIPEDKAECELSDTFKTCQTTTNHNHNIMLPQVYPLQSSDNDSPGFPNRLSSNDEVHRATQNVNMHFVKPSINSDQRFEDCYVDYSKNPFSNNSRQYIDDMTSSSGQLSGMDENADCLPQVEQMHISEQKTRFSEATNEQSNLARISYPQQNNFLGQKLILVKDNHLTLERHQSGSSEEMVPRPNRSSTAHEHAATMVKEVSEQDYEKHLLTDKTCKQNDDDEADLDIDEIKIDHCEDMLSPARRKRQSFKDDRTTERKHSSKKKLVSKQLHLMMPASGQVERSISHRQMQVRRPAQIQDIQQEIQECNQISGFGEQTEQQWKEGQLQSVTQSQQLVYRKIGQDDPLDAAEKYELESQATQGNKTQYETADQVVSNYQNLNFMPQKNEGRDRLEVLKQSREFNPVIEFDINSPYSSQRTSQLKIGSSRSNSDANFMTTSQNLTNSQNLSQALARDSKVLPFQQSIPENLILLKDSSSSSPLQTQQHHQQFLLTKQSSDQNPTIETIDQRAAVTDSFKEQSLQQQHMIQQQTTQWTTTQQDQGQMPPVLSPRTNASKASSNKLAVSSKTVKNSTTSSVKNSQIAHKQLNLNKKLMQNDQQLASAKSSKKLQSLSASLNAEFKRKETSQGKETANNKFLQINQFDFRAGKLSAQTTAHTPKAIKNKTVSKQYQSLSNTITQGINGTLNGSKSPIHIGSLKKTK